MAKQSAKNRYVLMPTHGLRFESSVASAPTINLMASMVTGRKRAPKAAARRKKARGAARKKRPTMAAAGVTLVESAGENRIKLVEATPQQIEQFRANNPGVRVVPEVFYFPEVVLPPAVKPAPVVTAALAAARATTITLKVVSRGDSSPIAGVRVIAFTNFRQRLGAEGTSTKKGVVKLKFNGPLTKIQRLYAIPEFGFWSTLKSNVSLSDGMNVQLRAIDFLAEDCVRHFYGKSSAADKLGKDVVVGVIDSGVDLKHADLKVANGFNSVPGEDLKDFGDNGTEGHGTHVAGIIASRGNAPTGLRGVAPNVTLHSYRVFGQGEAGASNFAIATAIDKAVELGCDLLNLSLGGGPDDPVLHSAISAARQNGIALIIAAGNDGRQAVSAPGRDPLAVAVSAMGVASLLPADSLERAEIAKPFGSDPDEFLAGFSNIGPEIDVTGPGVGVVSTVPAGYGVMSGTSMACPAVTGLAARLLSNDASIRKMKRNAARSEAILKLVFDACKLRGFGSESEGHGLPRP